MSFLDDFEKVSREFGQNRVFNKIGWIVFLLLLATSIACALKIPSSPATYVSAIVMFVMLFIVLVAEKPDIVPIFIAFLILSIPVGAIGISACYSCSDISGNLVIIARIINACFAACGVILISYWLRFSLTPLSR